jgi:hypothetical protein
MCKDLVHTTEKENPWGVQEAEPKKDQAVLYPLKGLIHLLHIYWI